MADNGVYHIAIWAIPLGDLGTALNNQTVSVTLNSSINNWAVTAATFHNVDQNTPANNFTDNTALSLDVTSSADDMAIDAIHVEGNGLTDVPDLSEGTGQTLVGDNIDAGGGFNARFSTSYELSTSTSTTMSWQNDGGTLYSAVTTHAGCNLQSAGTLPVELTSFRGQSTAAGAALTWTTATEENNEGFEVEHSTDGAAWHKLDFVAGHGTTLEEQSYTYLHTEATKGLNYYRLKQVDFDGKFEYSDVIGVEHKGEAGQVSALYPNPTRTGLVQMDYTAQREEEVVVSVFDVTGQLVVQRVIAVNSGQNNLSFDFSELSAGMYMVKVGSEGTPIQLVIE